MERKKRQMLGTVVAALTLFAVAILSHVFEKKTPFYKNHVAGSLTLGNASKVEILLIEDFRCRNCMAFSKQIIPKIQSNYIQTGKARFTLVPVSFLPGSQEISNAIFEVYKQAPSQFFSFLNALLLKYELSELDSEEVIEIAKNIDHVDILKLRHAVETSSHNQTLEKNLAWAKDIMGSDFRTPALYINGSPGSTYSFEAIQYQIDQMMGGQ